jgi:hypothetical protein
MNFLNSGYVLEWLFLFYLDPMPIQKIVVMVWKLVQKLQPCYLKQVIIKKCSVMGCKKVLGK